MEGLEWRPEVSFWRLWMGKDLLCDFEVVT